ncbi:MULTISPECIES: tripartite tricarboxylate transporter substrate binding protein [Rhizobium/Agrobacterium group]|uniref:tripartite tricarboxylate transporter substrate binding protein n=1 Tax=Rhizobium/Agrobacterium group TaxID=227290 RepID=UPI000B3F75B1|nr:MULTISPECIES: tripartite tricarboxylate transporter substrate binding protein [Rhizobium/Agrobacterium group]MCF1450427.1 tripartite tricarboxylate transporter substrate binding protein [Allorhizobium ampelinum]MCF1473291.1 tripartite tricarboxylate transporter substrate binding protein [Allorhizobium ampelinum]MCF1496127.1 tripartite tricarboxylate transporter substrate binding protein [Allorhizobium ampelinum]MVA48819.1 tripartite tricarboxylate transporter substrate binding protein [Agrob
MNMMRTAMLAASSLLATIGSAHAEWPKDRPIQMIVAFAPGGSTDVMARAMQPYLEKELGADIVIENRPGASGEIAYTALAKAKPDGYTFSYINTPGFLSMQVQRKLGYDPKTIKPIARIVDDPAAIVVPAASEIKTIAQFIEAAKAKPGAVSFGSSGIGTDDHLAIIILGAEAGTKITHIPFNGAGETRTAILGAQVTGGGLNVSEFGGNDTSGLRMINTFGKERSPELPDVPTAIESGFNVEMTSERGIAAPREVPAEIADRFAAAVKATLDNPEFQKQAKQMALPLAYLSGPDWEKEMPTRLARFQKIWDTTPWVQQ